MGEIQIRYDDGAAYHPLELLHAEMDAIGFTALVLVGVICTLLIVVARLR